MSLRGNEGLLAGSISSLFTACDADAEARAKILSTLGRVEALHLARSQEELEAAFDLLATRRVFFEFERLFKDEHVRRLVRAELACEIAGHAPVVKDVRAAELGDDLGERYALMVQLLIDAQPKGKPPAAVLEALAGWTAASAGIRLASYAPERWADWMVGMLWNFGRRALVDIARAAGLPWEKAIDGLITSRDRRLREQPFDQATSDEAARLLGIQ